MGLDANKVTRSRGTFTFIVVMYTKGSITSEIPALERRRQERTHERISVVHEILRKPVVKKGVVVGLQDEACKCRTSRQGLTASQKDRRDGQF